MYDKKLSIHDQLGYMIKACLCPALFFIFLKKHFVNALTHNVLYLTLYTFSFQINENRLSDTKCLTQDVLSP
jgi:hypothetical protein